MTADVISITGERPADDGDYHIPARQSLTDRVRRVLKQGDTFAVFDAHGDVPQRRTDDGGIFHAGTRFLSHFRMRLGVAEPLLLSSTVRLDNHMLTVDLTNPEEQREGDSVPGGSLHLFRSKFIEEQTLYEKIEISNYAARAIRLDLRFGFGADFRDLFEVRGNRRERRGRALPPIVRSRDVVLGYEGLDGVVRRTRIEFGLAPDRISADEASYTLSIEAKRCRELFISVRCEVGDEALPAIAFEDASRVSTERLERAARRACHVYTANEQFNHWLNRSAADIRMMVTETVHGSYPYAGVPWFSTPFGRDGIITAMQVLWIDPSIAAGVLRYLAATQAHEIDPTADAEPGKILHELRDGEMAVLREIPFGRYYGSVDSTPLFVMLASQYYEATGDLELAAELWPHVQRALEWIDRYGDADGDGFVEYGRRSKDGLVQQGWKDSIDPIFHRDGTLADGPIALAEVQGYTYAAKLGAAILARALGLEEDAARFDAAARDLRARFDRAFWCEELGTFALALDGAKRPCRVWTSNAGQCLFSGIVLPERVPRLASGLFSPEMYSGWGVRTVSESAPRYNPMSYHNGSVWPHDNALIAAGLADYRHPGASRILQGLFDASLFVDQHRLPELFCGFARRASEGPTLYPVACAPQSWSAAAPFLLLRAILGLRIEAHERRLRFVNPTLPPFLPEVTLTNLRVGEASVDVTLHRYDDDVGVNVTRRTAPVEVVTVK
jgi:glycogen debranching enzyme